MDDHLLAELSGRVSQVLLAAKVAREEIINQAREHAARLEQRSRRRQEQEAEEYLQHARRKGQEMFDEARRSSEAMLAEAHAERDAMLADLVTRRAMLEEEVESRQVELARLREACSAISRTVEEVLNRFGDRRSSSNAISSDSEVVATQRRRSVTGITSSRGLRRPS